MGTVDCSKYIFVWILSTFLCAKCLSAQQKNDTIDNFSSNVNDSVGFRIMMRIIPSGTTRQENFMRDSVWYYIRNDLRGVKVHIKKFPFIPDKLGVLGQIGVGNFDCYNKALPLKEKLIEDGYSDSFIASYHCQAEGHGPDYLRIITAKRCNEPEYLKNETDIEAFPWDSVLFKIKIGTYRDSIPDSTLSFIRKDLNDAFCNIIKFPDESYLITAGFVGSEFYQCYADALPLLDRIRSAGYSDAYIAAYICNNEMDLETAKEIKTKRCN